jgi:hypothetical protein
MLAIVLVLATATAGLTTVLLAGGAKADTSTVSDVPYSCTTNGFGNQTATYSATITDSVDPAAVDAPITYRFTVPFAQDPPPVTATYEGGTVSYRIPAGLHVTSVTTERPPGSNLAATARVEGDSIVVTSTGSQPIDGGTHPTPDLIVNGTVTAAAAGPGIVWRTPYQIVADVNAQFVGQVVATCTPNDPSVVIATTTVPAGPQPPRGVNQSIAAQQGVAKAVVLTATDDDTPADELTFSVTGPPAHGTLAGTAPTLTYTSDAGYVGPDSFVFTVRDPGGLEGTGTVNINVFSPTVIDNTPPTVTVSAPSNGAVYTPGQLVPATFSCADATTAVDLCSGSTANGAPVPTTVGVHIFAVDSRDSAGNRARSLVSYRVIDPAPTAQTFNETGQIPLSCDDPLPVTPRSLPATVAAPTSVGTEQSLTMRFAAGEGSVPALTTATNLVFTLAPPANGVVQSAAVAPGTGTANAVGSASVAVTGGKVVLTIAGPIDGGATAPTTYTPPAVDVVIRATSTPGVAVSTRLESYRETTAVTGLPQVPTTRTCTAGNPAAGEPNPVLTRTTVLDTTPPAITVSQPTHGALLGQGEPVTADYACTDETALAACAGTTADGAAFNTSTPGVRTLLVSAVDAAGNVAQRLTSTRVVVTTFVTRFASSEVGLLDQAAAHLTTDRAGVARTGAALLQFFVAVAGPPAQLLAEPANSGPIVVTNTYAADAAQRVALTASQYGVTGDGLHRVGASLVMFLVAISR